MGTQINKNASKGACRDLSGRRVRDVKAEKRYVRGVCVYIVPTSSFFLRIWFLFLNFILFLILEAVVMF